MEWWTAFQAFILGVVEGLTEFLPISSTGHQIIVADLIGFGGERAKAFNIIIQLRRSSLSSGNFGERSFKSSVTCRASARPSVSPPTC